MTVVVSCGSYIINFLDVRFNTDSLELILKNYVEYLLKKNNIECLPDWILKFSIIFSSGTYITCGSRLPSCKNSKLKSISIIIPIPNIEKCHWGVENQFFAVKPTESGNKYLIYQEAKFELYRSIEEYCIPSLKSIIDECFTKGFTVNGFKITLKNV